MDINPFEPMTLIFLALLNPAVIVVAVLMGRSADQWQKVPVAAFAAALSGFVLYWIVCQIGIIRVHALGGEAGLVVLQFFFGLVLAGFSYRFLRPRS